MVFAPDGYLFAMTGRIRKHLVPLDSEGRWTHRALCGARVKYTAEQAFDDDDFCTKCNKLREQAAS